jgi:hypothetical protein
MERFSKKHLYSIDSIKIFAKIRVIKEKEMKNMFDENGNEWLVDDATGWDPIMGDEEDWVETDDEWLDDFQGEEDFA